MGLLWPHLPGSASAGLRGSLPPEAGGELQPGGSTAAGPEGSPPKRARTSHQKADASTSPLFPGPVSPWHSDGAITPAVSKEWPQSRSATPTQSLHVASAPTSTAPAALAASPAAAEVLGIGCNAGATQETSGLFAPPSPPRAPLLGAARAERLLGEGSGPGALGPEPEPQQQLQPAPSLLRASAPAAGAGSSSGSGGPPSPAAGGGVVPETSKRQSCGSAVLEMVKKLEAASQQSTPAALVPSPPLSSVRSNIAFFETRSTPSLRPLGGAANGGSVQGSLAAAAPNGTTTIVGGHSACSANWKEGAAEGGAGEVSNGTTLLAPGVRKELFRSASEHARGPGTLGSNCGVTASASAGRLGPVQAQAPASARFRVAPPHGTAGDASSGAATTTRRDDMAKPKAIKARALVAAAPAPVAGTLPVGPSAGVGPSGGTGTGGKRLVGKAHRRSAVMDPGPTNASASAPAPQPGPATASGGGQEVHTVQRRGGGASSAAQKESICVRQIELPPKVAEDNYELSEAGDSEEEPVDRERASKFVPLWCESVKDVLQLLIRQENVDPDTIFTSRVPRCTLEDIFTDEMYHQVGRNRPKRTRGSSGDWRKDRLTRHEVLQYKSRMGQIRAWTAGMPSTAADAASVGDAHGADVADKGCEA